MSEVHGLVSFGSTKLLGGSLEIRSNSADPLLAATGVGAVSSVFSAACDAAAEVIIDPIRIRAIILIHL